MRYLVVTTYPPTRCGIGAYASQSVKKLRNEGHIVDIISPNKEGNVDFKYDLQGGFKPLKILKLGVFYDRIIIQYHSSFFFVAYNSIRERISNIATHVSFIILFLLNRRIEVVCHEIERYSFRTVGLLNYVAHRLMWFIAPRLIFHTPKELGDFTRNVLFGFHTKRLVLRPHNRDFNKFREISMREARCELDIPLDAKIFLCIGFIQPHKGFDRAMSVFHVVNPPNARLYIVGSLRLVYDVTLTYRSLLRYIASQNPNIVLIEQFVSDQKFDTWISACDYVVVPYHEIWSSGVVARAKLFGKKVIASNTGGLSDQLDEQDFLYTNDTELEALVRMLCEERAPFTNTDGQLVELRT